VGRVLGQRSIRQRVRQAVRRCEGESSRQGGQPSFDEPPQQQRWKKGTQDKPDPSDAGFNPACIQLCIINIILAQTNATHDPISCVSASGRSNLTQGAASPTRADRQVVIFTTSRQHAPHLKIINVFFLGPTQVCLPDGISDQFIRFCRAHRCGHRQIGRHTHRPRNV